MPLQPSFNNAKYTMATSGFTMLAGTWIKAETTLSRDNPDGKHRSAISLYNESAYFGYVSAVSGLGIDCMFPLPPHASMELERREPSGPIGQDIFVYAGGGGDICIKVIELH